MEGSASRSAPFGVAAGFWVDVRAGFGAGKRGSPPGRYGSLILRLTRSPARLA
jgi:hypothetical protein